MLQAVRPWLSSRDLDRGSVWFSDINEQLEGCTVGIICLTLENRERPWILFEAGALFKGLSKSRISPLLIDLETKDVEDPLGQLNHTFPTQQSMRQLVGTLNGMLNQQSLDEATLNTVFDTYWPQFEAKFAAILANTKQSANAKPREQGDVLGDIL